MIIDFISGLMILSGAILCFSAAVGVHRFHDTLSTIHAVTKPQTTGLVLTIIGSILHVVGHPDFSLAQRSDVGIMVLLVFFAMLTNPVTAQRVGRITRREGLYGEMERNDAPANRPVRSHRRQ
ncbi:cation:proton antiporter [Corynebacterium poyangense]|uniref:Cation:proton antiporter n=1 Tax=Corynebacterium poyangense TaxID=2684405 RepID=A0A7H0SRA8_9CORY|nr:monovalent cation/H(+) antiporter subunit G [Corynebacterium poyangense]MBZ8176515.1 cation:proton antiporter [Corynebacterium poyangense]QNQ91083.1 cation:proton antiporter [Corynebacterium poyangense]